MTFVDAIKSGFKNYAQFRGVATRPEYWWFFLFSMLAAAVTSTMDAAIWGNSDAYLNAIYSLVFFLPSLSITVRRFRDAGFSWLWLLLLLVPISGFVAWVFNNINSLMVFVDFAANSEIDATTNSAVMDFLSNNPEFFQLFGQLGLIILIFLAVTIFHFVITLLPTKKSKVDAPVAPITY